METDMFEIDCQLTRDRQVVVSHDDHLVRTAGTDVFISKTDYQDLPSIKSTLEVQFEPCRTSSGTDTRIPLLRELFDLFPDVPINIDLKEGGDTIIQEVQQLIEDYQRERLTVWGNGHMATNKLCRQKNPEILTFVSVKGAILILIAFYTGLLPFIPINRECLEMPMPSVGLKKDRFKHVLSWKARLAIFLTDWMVMCPVLFKHLRRRGMHVYLWVLNDENEFRRAYQLGVDGVMTDYPTKLKKFLEENPALR